MSAIDSSNFIITSELIKKMFEEVTRDKQQLEEEKKKWEEDKAKINCFDERKIVLDVGGTRYTTSRSTLTKYPESMLGVMFSGRHDIEAMKCSDGSFFIDRDGTHFRHILNYLRDGEEVVRSFPKTLDTLQGIFREAEYYQLEGLVGTLKPFICQCDVLSQDDIEDDFVSVESYSCGKDYGLNALYGNFRINSHSIQAISYQMKNAKRLYFKNLKFLHPVSFISCDLRGACFCESAFESDVTFNDCLLDGTCFSDTKGFISNVSFIDSKTDNTKFAVDLQIALKSAGKIN